jgi:hypothetical protein
MRIDEVILSEKEFGALRRAGKSMANYTAGALGKVGFKKMANMAMKGGIEKKAMIGANKVSDAFVKFQAAKFPDADPNTLNVENFKTFMKTSAKLKGEVANFNFLSGYPELQKFMKQSTPDSPITLSNDQKEKLFLGIANTQLAGGSPATGSRPMSGGTTDTEFLAKADKNLSVYNKEQLTSLINIAKQKLQQS